MTSIWKAAACIVLVAGAVVGLRLVGCGGGDDHRPKRVTIAVARESGKHAKAGAEGIARHPAAIAIRASAAPKQRVVVTWGLSCPRTKGGHDKGTGGTYTTTPPNVRPLTLPQRTIAFCAVRAEAQLARSGRVKVTVLASEG